MEVQPTVWHFSGDMKTMKGSMSQSAGQMTLLLPTSIGGEKATVMLIGLLMPPQNASPVQQNTNDKSSVNADLSGWKWEAFVPDNSGSGSGDMGSNTGEGSASDKRSYTSGNFVLDLDGLSAGVIQKVDGGGVIGDVVGG